MPDLSEAELIEIERRVAELREACSDVFAPRVSLRWNTASQLCRDFGKLIALVRESKEAASDR